MDQGDLEAALSTYMEALEHSPDNPDILTTLGITFLRLGDNQRAFDSLGSSLLHDPRNPRTLLAVGSIIQVCKIMLHTHEGQLGSARLVQAVLQQQGSYVRTGEYLNGLVWGELGANGGGGEGTLGGRDSLSACVSRPAAENSQVSECAVAAGLASHLTLKTCQYHQQGHAPCLLLVTQGLLPRHIALHTPCWVAAAGCRTTKTWMWPWSSTEWLLPCVPTARSCGTT